MQAIEAIKSVSPKWKTEDKFDGLNLLGIIRIELEFGKKKCRKANQGGLQKLPWNLWIGSIP